MLGRKTYTREELDSATSTMQEQLAAYRALPPSPERDAFEPLFFNHLTLALDRRFVHRLRVSAGKDGNALSEVELLVESLLNNGGVLRGNNVIKYVPEQAVLGLEPGDEIAIGAGDFERLSGVPGGDRVEVRRGGRPAAGGVGYAPRWRPSCSTATPSATRRCGIGRGRGADPRRGALGRPAPPRRGGPDLRARARRGPRGVRRDGRAGAAGHPGRLGPVRRRA